jgi:hypothetical protein
MAGNEPKGQHYVHRAYLANFQDPEFERRDKPALWVYLPEKQPFRQRPDRVARRNYYYCYDEKEKRQYVAEHGLQKLEDLALPILRNLCNRKFTLTAEDRLTFAGYIAMAHTRVPAFERFLNFSSSLITAKKLELLANDKRALASIVKEMSDRTGEAIDAEDFRRKLTGGSVVITQGNRGWTVQRMFENLLMLQQVIFDMKWAFLLSAHNADGFLTSDNPVSLFDPAAGPMRGIGFASSPVAHFTFPLSRDVCLLAQHMRGPETSELDAVQVRSINKANITRADSQVYAPFCSLGVQRLLNDVTKQKGGPRKVLFTKGRTVVKHDESA